MTADRRSGGGSGQRRTLPALLGPAFVAAVAYVDPGNVAANITAGARYGYLLVWVLVCANTMAVLVQYLSARLGLVTGQSLPELVGDRLRRGPRLAYWAQAELVAAATDLAEVIGGALALRILFGVPLLIGGVIVGLVSLGLLAVQSRHGQRPFELVVIGLLLVIASGFLVGLFVAPVSWPQAAEGLVPRLAGSDTVLLAASMLGATVMPHAIYVHSALVRDRGTVGTPLPRLLRATRWDVVGSLGLAGTVNLAMLVLAAAALHGVDGTDTIEGAQAAISQALGPVVGVAFGIGLLASGFASTSVGAYAGATIMAGLLRVRIPMVVRRAVTLMPALVLLAVGVDPTWALVLSQVLLSLGIPFALVPLVRLNADPAVMGTHTAS
ncbi:MAG: Nramp family divalent metal transporter, partial [Cellulomonas sp.]|nr:Nramp family divalent metal transporter [Cellulomonas sp.]